jgi:WD40 repeat protein
MKANLEKCKIVLVWLALMILSACGEIATAPILLTPVPVSTDEAPYIYYYSRLHNAIVIERADGTDSRIMTKIDSAEYRKMVLGPGWSPSGRWLAVNVVFVIQGFPQHSLEAFLIDQSGQTRISAIGDSQREVKIEMTWSPIEDILLIEYSYTNAVSHAPEGHKIKLFDVTTQRITLEYDLPGNPAAMFNVEWASDGQSLHIFYAAEDTLSKTYLRTIDLTGKTLHERRIDNSCGGYQVYPSSDNRVFAVVVDGALLLSDTATAEVIKTLPFQQSVISYMDWSQDGHYALVYTASSCSDISKQLWLLSLPDYEIHFLLDNVDLPPQRFLSVLGRYSATSVSVWSTCQQKAFAVSEERLYLITAESSDVKLVGLPAEKMLSFTGWDNCNLLVAIYNYQTGSNLYQVTPGVDHAVLYPLKELPQAIRYVSISPTKTYIAYADYPHSYIENTFTGENTEIVLLDSNQYLGRQSSFMQVVWHPHQNWFLTLIDSESEHLINVISADTDAKRELTLCFNALSCFGWLP